MDQLLQKLMISKQIMDKHNGIQRGAASPSIDQSPEIQSFDLPQAKYNIPSEFLSEQPTSGSPLMSSPRENTKPVGVPTLEAIQKSKLPDEIKKLMIEHPISQPQQQQMTISDDLIEKASRLMKGQTNNYIPESAKPTKTKSPVSNNQSIDYNIIKEIVNEAVENILRENGVIVESTEKSNETFSFRVGKHLFEGKVTKIKKLS